MDDSSGAENNVGGGLYGALGVKSDASAADLKKGYRDCAKRWHPDKTAHMEPDEKAAADAKFEAAREAYEVLSDPQRREVYDGTGETTGGATQHEAAGYLAEVFGDLTALAPFFGTLWLELLFCDTTAATAKPKDTVATTKAEDPGVVDTAASAGYTSAEPASGTTSQPLAPAGEASSSGVGVRLAQHLYASAAYSMMPTGAGRTDEKKDGSFGSKGLLQHQAERESALRQELCDRLFLLDAGRLAEADDESIRVRLHEIAEEAAGVTRPRGLRLLKSAAQGFEAASSWSLFGPRAVHAAKAQWSLARAAGAATWALAGGCDEAAAEHAAEAVTRLSEADVLCTCFAAKAALLEELDSDAKAATLRRIPLLAAALTSSADAAEVRAAEAAAAQYARVSTPSAPPKHRLKMPGGMLYLGAASHKDGDGQGDLLPHGEGRLFLADGSCHDGHFDTGRADGRGRLFGSVAAQEGCVWEGSWKQNRRVGAFEVWDAKGVLWLERYDETGKKVARKKAPAAVSEETGALLESARTLHPAVPCTRCGLRFQERWGSVQWCRSHKDGIFDESKSAWSCCAAAEKNSPGCDVAAHEAAK